MTKTVLADVMVEAVYPEFYKLGINSDKSGDVLESEFLKEECIILEFVEELYHFVPPLFNGNDSKENIERVLDNNFQKYCRHLFPLRRDFANYRQEQYLNTSCHLKNLACTSVRRFASE